MKTAKDTLISFYHTPEQVIALLRSLAQDTVKTVANMDAAIKIGNTDYAMTYFGQIKEDVEMINRLLTKAKAESIDLKKEIADETNKN